MAVADAVLILARLIVFALVLGLVLISFQAYRQRPSKRLETAFIGFSFLAMGVALTTLRAQFDQWRTLFEIVETLPFILGFSMLYLSLYR